MPMTCLLLSLMHSKARPEARAHAYDLPTTLYLLPSLQCLPPCPPSTLNPLPSAFLLPTLYPPLPSTLSPAAYLLPAPLDASGCRRLAGSDIRGVPPQLSGPRVRRRLQGRLKYPGRPDSDIRVVKAEDLPRRRHQGLTYKGWSFMLRGGRRGLTFKGWRFMQNCVDLAKKRWHIRPSPINPTIAAHQFTRHGCPKRNP